MTILEEMRQRLPEYNDLPDPQFSKLLRLRFAPNVPEDQWNKSIGYEPMSTGEDVLRSAGTGAMHGLADVVALPGNLLGMTNDLGDWAYSKFTGQPPPQHKQLLPKSEDINNMMSDLSGKVTGSPVVLHQPETTAGRYAGAAAEGITSAAIPFGGARTIGQLGMNALRQGAVPALAGEGAGDLAQKYIPSAEGAVRALTPVVTGGVGSLTEKAPKGKIPAANLDKMIGDNYAASEAAGIVIKPQAMAGIARNVITDVIRRGNLNRSRVADPDWAKVNSSVHRLNELATAPTTLRELDDMRKQINHAVTIGDSEASRASMIMKTALDKEIDRLNAAHVVGNVSPKEAVGYLKEGRRLANMKFKSDFIQKMINDANIEAEARGGLSLPDRLRTKFSILAKNDDYMKTLDPKERQAIYAVFGKGTVRDIARYAAKLAPTTPLKGLLETFLGGALGGSTVSDFSDWGQLGSHGLAAPAVLMGSGLAGKGVDYATTKRAANTAETVMRGAKRPESRAGLSASQMLTGHSRDEEQPDYSGKPGPLMLDVTKPANSDEINAWRTQMGLPPLGGGPAVPTGP